MRNNPNFQIKDKTMGSEETKKCPDILWIRFFATLCFILLLGISNTYDIKAGNPSMDANQLLDMIDEQLYPDDFEAVMTMVNYDKPNHVDSRYTYKVMSKLNVGSLLIVTEPPAERGTKILMKEENMWMYVPGNARTVRLAKSEDFMGSTFSNSDLMDADMKDDYNASYASKPGLPDSFIFIQLKAKRNDVPYARIDMYIWKTSLIPAIFEYYSRSGQQLKKLIMSDIKEMAGRKRPVKMVMESLFDPGKKTVVEVISMQERPDLSSSIFNEARLIE